MKTRHFPLLLVASAVLSLPTQAQVTRILIPAGSPEDVAIQEIANEHDPDKATAMLQDFVQKFSANPMAVAYGNQQLSQQYATKGDMAQALAYGDKALAALPNNLEILLSQANLATQAKDYMRVVEYASRGGLAIQGIGKEVKPQEMTDEQFALRVKQDQESAQQSNDYLESLGLNAIAAEPDANQKMAEVEKFEAGFPRTKYAPQLADYAVVALQQMNDITRLAAYGDKAVAANPNNASLLSVLASALVDSPAYFERGMQYAQKAITLAKADAPDATAESRLAAGTAHTALGFGMMKQEKNAAAATELKKAVELLRSDPIGSQKASYLLAWDYAKMKNYAEARQILNKLVAMDGPYQQPARDLLAKVTPKK